MRKIIIVAAVVVMALGAGFTYTLYKVGEGMHLHRCGCVSSARQGSSQGM